jgi:hypothetical protein
LTSSNPQVTRGPSSSYSVQRLTDHHHLTLPQNNCTMDTPLVDPEGFPRADIDVAGVRTARVHIIRLRNDLRALLREMEQLVLRGLPREAGDPSRDEGLLRANGDMRMNGEGGHDEEDDEQERPFARVDAVAPNSPAHQAVTSPFSLFFSSSVKSRQTDFGSRPPGACV